LAHPGYVSRLKQSPDKSDHDDAEVLADLLRVDYLPEVWLPPIEILQLRRLVRYRQGLASERKNIKQRIRALLREERMPKPDCNAWTKAWFQWIREAAPLLEQARWVMDQLLQDLENVEQRMTTTEERMRTSTEHDPTTQALLGQKGVGLVTAVTLRAEIGEFTRFHSGKQLARFCTVTPLNTSSGTHQVEGGLVRQGNRELRRVVLEAAQRLARYEPKWQELKEHLKRQGKPGAVAVAAVANRWVRWLYHQMKEVPALAA
jgi:transposase